MEGEKMIWFGLHGIQSDIWIEKKKRIFWGKDLI
jgi:hypothetical protein